MFKPSRLLRPSDARRRARGDLGTDSVRPELPLFYVPVSPVARAARDDLNTDSVRPELPLFYVPVSPVARVAICKPCPVALVPTLGLQLLFSA